MRRFECPSARVSVQGLTKGPLPTIVYVHGGPESQETARFNIAIQYFVNHGFLVLAPNVRGSAGYGKKWVHLDDVEKRLDSVHDLEALVRWAVKAGLSVPGRIGIMGGSYGGFMVLSALSEYPTLWGAGVCSVGIANLETFLENTARWRRHLREAEYGSLEKNRELLRRISPIHQVERITSPLMIIHGVNDPRVPVGEADQIVSELKDLGRHVEYIRFDDEGHGIAKIKNRVRANNLIGEFFQKSLSRSGGRES
ncbi:MAG TPA: alpha/beta fold hydrolase [Candidatus Binatus sp.]|nr:alpha/beta fold hydrolase [Candidatus Binatus sp.]